MTNTEINVAIAECCGWTAEKNCGFGGGFVAKHPSVLGDTFLGNTAEQAILRNCPNYVSDLNAMHEALVNLLKRRKLRAFCNAGKGGTWECVITENESPNCIPCDGDHYGAGDTLGQAMTEAFLRTVGKWRDDDRQQDRQREITEGRGGMISPHP